MDHDHSSTACDTITSRSGQFGFFQKRIFIINTLIQSACLSILLYTTACTPGLEESTNQERRSTGIPSTLLPSRNHTPTIATTNNMDNAHYLQDDGTTPPITTTTTTTTATTTVLSNLAFDNFTGQIEDNTTFPSSSTTSHSSSSITTATGFVNISGPVSDVAISSATLATTPSPLAWVTQTTAGADLWLIEATSDGTFPSNFSTSDNGTMSTATASVYGTSTASLDHPLFRELLPKTDYLSTFTAEDLAKLLSLLQGVGAIVGTLIGGLMADIYGRRRPLYLAMTGMTLGQCAVGFAGSWLTFLISRALTVGFAGASAVISFLMIIEFVGPGWRDVCACSSLWTFGAIALAVQSLVTSHWRWMAFSTAGLCIPLVASFFTAVESARWLQCHHRFTEAEGLYRELISVNAAAVPEIMALLDQARACIVNNMHRKRYTFLDLFYNLKSTRSTLALIYTGVVSSCVYTCLMDRVRHVTGVAYLDSCLPFIIDLPLTWSVIVVNRCLGRRWCLFLYAVASGFALLSVLVLHVTGNMSYMPSLITGLALFGKIGVTASIAIIFLTAIEMYPTVTRGMGAGVALASTSGGALLSFAMVFLDGRHYTVPFIAYGGLMASVGLVGLLLPETLNQPLANVQQCRHRKIPLMEGARLVGSPPSLWDTV